VYSGRYGPYVKHGKVNASLPKGTSADEVTLEQAVALIAEKQKKPATRKKKTTAKKTTQKKSE